MSVSSIIGKIIGNSAASPIEAIGNVIGKLYTTEGEKLDKQIIMQRLLQKPQEAQAEINKIEAAHRSLFVAGGRPAIIWVCALALAAYFLPQFILGSFLWVKMCLAKNILLPYPVNGKYLIDLIGALLGLGSLRTFEKLTGKTK